MLFIYRYRAAPEQCNTIYKQFEWVHWQRGKESVRAPASGYVEENPATVFLDTDLSKSRLTPRPIQCLCRDCGGQIAPATTIFHKGFLSQTIREMRGENN